MGFCHITALLLPATSVRYSDAMVQDAFPGFAHSVPAELAEARHLMLMDWLSVESYRHWVSVANVAAGALQTPQVVLQRDEVVRQRLGQRARRPTEVWMLGIRIEGTIYDIHSSTKGTAGNRSNNRFALQMHDNFKTSRRRQMHKSQRGNPTCTFIDPPPPAAVPASRCGGGLVCPSLFHG